MPMSQWVCRSGAGVVLCLAVAAVRADDDQPRAEQMRSAVRDAVSSQPAEPDDAAVRAEYEALLKARSPAIVRIKYVQKTQGSFGDYAGENEITGVMIEPTGLVVCSNTRLGGARGRFRSGRSVPTKIKVLIGDDTEGIDARFVARDTELDLAWLRISDPGDRRFAYVDLADTEKPVLGQRILALGIMGKYFGETVLVSEGRMAGRTHRPRELYVFRGSLDTDAGLPVFTPAGKLVGFACLQRPDPEEMTGDTSSLTTRGWGLILPADTVARATVRAKEVREGEEAEGGDEPEPPAKATAVPESQPVLPE